MSFMAINVHDLIIRAPGWDNHVLTDTSNLSENKRWRFRQSLTCKVARSLFKLGSRPEAARCRADQRSIIYLTCDAETPSADQRTTDQRRRSNSSRSDRRRGVDMTHPAFHFSSCSCFASRNSFPWRCGHIYYVPVYCCSCTFRLISSSTL